MNIDEGKIEELRLELQTLEVLKAKQVETLAEYHAFSEVSKNFIIKVCVENNNPYSQTV